MIGGDPAGGPAKVVVKLGPVPVAGVAPAGVTAHVYVAPGVWLKTVKLKGTPALGGGLNGSDRHRGGGAVGAGIVTLHGGPGVPATDGVTV